MNASHKEFVDRLNVIRKQSLLDDENFLSALVMPELQVYLLWNGGPMITYYAFKGDDILFQGNDYKPSPMHGPDSLDSMVDLLGFLTVSPGGADKEYFASYTPEQMAWAESFEAEQLSGLVSDFDNSGSEYQAEAIEKLESYFSMDPKKVIILCQNSQSV